MISNLSDLVSASKRYQKKRSNSNDYNYNEEEEESRSDSSSKSSGYGSILSEDEEQLKKNYDDDDDDDDEKEEKFKIIKRSETIKSYDDGGEHRPLDDSNKGMKLLIKMGWTQGTGLGLNSSGRKVPIPTPAQTPLLGLGKATQDAYMLDNTISKPKELESLVIARETEEGRAKREEKVKVVQLREEEREDRLKTFHCSICDKGYTTIGQFEEHERSYAHHHARRALEAKQARKSGGPSAEALLEKERKREAKELERMANAAGIRLEKNSAKPTTDFSASQKSIISTTSTSSTGPGTGFKRVGGWAPIKNSSKKDSSTSFKSGFSSLETKNDDNRSGSPSGPIRFKSSGFAPISNSVTPKPSFSEPITNFVQSSQDGYRARPPSFVPASSSSSSKSTIDRPITRPEGDLQEGFQAEKKPPEEGQPVSKFAQIAARIAAKRAAGDVPVRSNAPRTKPKDPESELERMLEDGF